jgi:hypothetical protein
VTAAFTGALTTICFLGTVCIREKLPEENIDPNNPAGNGGTHITHIPVTSSLVEVMAQTFFEIVADFSSSESSLLLLLLLLLLPPQPTS